MKTAENASGWTDERTELAKKLWNDGLSATEVAKRLGGVTRNAVIGKMYRIGALGNKPTKRAADRPANRVAASAPRSVKGIKLSAPKPVRVMEPKGPTPAPAALAPPPLQLVPETAKPWSQRGLGECSWPVAGQGEGIISCCRPLAGRWCAEHNAIGSVPVKKYKTAKVASQVAWQERQAHASIEEIAAKTDGRRWA